MSPFDPSPNGEQAAREGLRGTRYLSAIALVLLLWSASFYPVLLEHRSLSIASLLDARASAMPASPGEKRSQKGPLKSQDASFLQVHLPMQAFLASHWKLGHYPQWNPLVGLGHPVSSDPLYKPTDPFLWPFFAAPSVWTFSLGIALNSLAGALGCALFLAALGLGWEAVVLGASLFAVGPLTSQSLVFSSAWGAWIVMWGMLGAERWVQGKQWGLPLAAAACAVVVYCGHPLIAPLHVSAVLAYLLLRTGHVPWPRRLAAPLAVSVAVAVLTAFHTLPLLANLHLYESYKVLWDGGPFHGFVELVDPRSPIYLPASFLALVLLGATCRGRVAVRAFCLLLVAYGLLLMLPSVGGAPRLVLSLGGLVVGQYGEEPLWLGVLILMALGMDDLVTRPERERRRTAVAGAMFLYGILSVWIFADAVGGLYWRDHFIGTALWEMGRCLLLAALCLWGRPLRILALTGTLALALLPLTLPFPLSRFYTQRDILLEPPPVVRRLAAMEGLSPRWRVSGALPRDASLPILMPNQASMWGLADLRFCHPLMLRTYVAAAQPWNRADIFPTMEFFPRQDPESLAFFGVRYVLDDAVRPSVALPEGERVEALALKEIPGAEPWARLVGSWQIAANQDDETREAVEFVRSGRWRKEVVLDRAPSWGRPSQELEPGGEGISWESGTDNAWSWAVSVRDPAIFVLIMNIHPAWTANVDGQPAPLLRTYGGFMGVALAPGRHKVELAFRDPWLTAGAWITALGWAGMAPWLWLGFRRGRRPRLAPKREGPPAIL